MLKQRSYLPLLLLSLVLCGCASRTAPIVKPVEISPPKLPPVPSDVMVTQKADFLERLIQHFSLPKPAEPTR